MLVSIIVPSYNHEKFIEQCIRSIMSQDYKNFELIVIDDGSRDKSHEILKQLESEFSFQLILKSNEGVTKTLNRGIDLASGELITFLASDDLMPPTRISEQVTAMQENPDYDVITGAIQIINEDGKLVRNKKLLRSGEIKFEQLIQRNCILAPTAVFRRSTFEKFGKYSEELLIEDYSMWLKILKAGGKILNKDQVWAIYRVTNINLEKRFKWYYDGFMQTLNEYSQDSRVIAQISRYQFIFIVKMVMLRGFSSISENKKIFHKLTLSQKAIALTVALTPQILRSYVLNKLLIHY